ncbi:MAG: hypothetical protein AAFV59_15490 [Pseudomonadota bacterium]
MNKCTSNSYKRNGFEQKGGGKGRKFAPLGSLSLQFGSHLRTEVTKLRQFEAVLARFKWTRDDLSPDEKVEIDGLRKAKLPPSEREDRIKAICDSSRAAAKEVHQNTRRDAQEWVAKVQLFSEFADLSDQDQQTAAKLIDQGHFDELEGLRAAAAEVENNRKSKASQRRADGLKKKQAADQGRNAETDYRLSIGGRVRASVEVQASALGVLHRYESYVGGLDDDGPETVSGEPTFLLYAPRPAAPGSDDQFHPTTKKETD